jgi:hypothetical protein
MLEVPVFLNRQLESSFSEKLKKNDCFLLGAGIINTFLSGSRLKSNQDLTLYYKNIILLTKNWEEWWREAGCWFGGWCCAVGFHAGSCTNYDSSVSCLKG